MPEQPAAAGAQGRADCKFTVARLGTGQQQVGQIRAGNQQHETNRDLQDPDRAAGLAKDRVLHRLHLEDVGAIPIQWDEDVIRDRETGTLAPVLDQAVQFCLCRLRRDAVGQAANQIEEVVAAALAIVFSQPEGQPDLGAVIHDVRAGRHDADDFALPVIHIHRMPDDRLSSKRGLPQLVREDHDRRRQRRRLPGRWRWADCIGLSRRKQASLRGRHAEHMQQMLIDVRRTHAQRPIASGEIHGTRPVGSDV